MNEPPGPPLACAGDLQSPKWAGPMAKEYPFVLDPFQQVAIACLVRHPPVPFPECSTATHA
jgi:ATP-dependent RNA helicase DOB1